MRYGVCSVLAARDALSALCVLQSCFRSIPSFAEAQGLSLSSQLLFPLWGYPQTLSVPWLPFLHQKYKLNCLLSHLVPKFVSQQSGVPNLVIGDGAPV